MNAKEMLELYKKAGLIIKDPTYNITIKPGDYTWEMKGFKKNTIKSRKKIKILKGK